MKLNCSSAIKLLQKLLTFTGIQARQLKSLLEAKFSFIYARSYLMYALMTTNENFYTSESFIEHVFDDTKTTKKDNHFKNKPGKLQNSKNVLVQMPYINYINER